jgi:hypothetical protein
VYWTKVTQQLTLSRRYSHLVANRSVFVTRDTVRHPRRSLFRKFVREPICSWWKAFVNRGSTVYDTGELTSSQRSLDVRIFNWSVRSGVLVCSTYFKQTGLNGVWWPGHKNKATIQSHHATHRNISLTHTLTLSHTHTHTYSHSHTPARAPNVNSALAYQTVLQTAFFYWIETNTLTHTLTHSLTLTHTHTHQHAHLTWLRHWRTRLLSYKLRSFTEPKRTHKNNTHLKWTHSLVTENKRRLINYTHLAY